MKKNGCRMFFQYDSEGNVVSMMFNGTRYYYVKNQQGDVEKIVPHQGNVVVTYKYDAWGNPLHNAKKLSIKLTDSRWPSSAGWVKIQRVITTSKGKIVIHFLYNTESMERFGFFEVKIQIITADIKLTNNFYITEDDICRLSDSIKVYISGDNKNMFWEIGEKDLGLRSYFSIKIIENDGLGHLIIEVYINLQEEYDNKYHCTLAIKTEIGLLSNFGESILLLNKSDIGTSVDLLS